MQIIYRRFRPMRKIIARGLLHNRLTDWDSSELFWWRRNTTRASSSHLPASVTGCICSHRGNPQDEPASLWQAVMSSVLRSQQLWVSGITLQGQRQRDVILLCVVASALMHNHCFSFSFSFLHKLYCTFSWDKRSLLVQQPWQTRQIRWRKKTPRRRLADTGVETVKCDNQHM